MKFKENENSKISQVFLNLLLTWTTEDLQTEKGSLVNVNSIENKKQQNE